MVDGGALWFTDLTVADPTYALPILCSLSFLATVELGAADGMQGQPPETLKRMKMMMRILAIVIVPFTASMPAVRISVLVSRPLRWCCECLSRTHSRKSILNSFECSVLTVSVLLTLQSVFVYWCAA